MSDLQNKIAIVTGANSGMGMATAEALSDQGATVLFTRELAVRLKGRGITVNCCHPGAVATNMGVDRETGFGKTITGLLKPFFLTPAEGAATAIYLATDDSVSHISGGYFYKCRIAKSSKRSKSRKLAKRLYELSEEMVRA